MQSSWFVKAVYESAKRLSPGTLQEIEWNKQAA